MRHSLSAHLYVFCMSDGLHDCVSVYACMFGCGLFGIHIFVFDHCGWFHPLFAYLYAYFVADELYGCLWMCSCFALAVGFM